MVKRRHPVATQALPKDLATQAVALFGRARIVDWCEALLSGAATTDDADLPDIAWLGGTPGWVDYWARVWGARGLLHIGPPAHDDVVRAGLGDEHWRVREMCLKVIRRHGIDDPDGLIEALVDDPVDRVRVQAWTTLGLPTEAWREGVTRPASDGPAARARTPRS